MTTNRLLLLTLILALPASLMAAPPDLVGKFLTIGSERFEFPTQNTGSSDSGGAIQYTYATIDSSTATLDVTYAGSGASREITLNFLSDGSASDYMEFVSTPPLPPMPVTGAFTMGDIPTVPEVPETPVVESSAPDRLAGKVALVGGRVFEFLTEAIGRSWDGESYTYFGYDYGIIDERTAAAAAEFEGGGFFVLEMTFRGSGRARSATLAIDDGAAERFGLRLKDIRTSTDLLIGAGELDLVGDDIYHRRRGARQSFDQAVSDTARFQVVVQNDGLDDSFVIDGSPSRRRLDIAYFSGSENITAGVVTGTYMTPSLGYGETHAIDVEATPKGRRGFRRMMVRAISATNDRSRDKVYAGLRIVDSTGNNGPQ